MIFDNVKRLASEQKLTIKEVERRAGLENGTISKWTGKTSPRLENAMKVAEVLGVDVNDLVKETT